MSGSLSPRVLKLLNHRPRTEDFSTIATELAEVLKRENCQDHPIFPFQLHYGGYSYKIRGHTEVVRLGVSQPIQIKDLDGHLGCEFGGYSTFQGTLEMDEQGLIYSADWNVQNPIASSIEIFLEDHAMEDALFDEALSWHWASSEFLSRDLYKIELRLGKLGFVPILEASDEYINWWVSPECKVRRITMWASNKPISIIRAYALSPHILEEVGRTISDLMKHQWVSPFKLYTLNGIAG